MFPAHHHYVPVLKWKRGEQHAVKGISPLAKTRIAPILEFVSVTVDLKTGQPKKTLSDHIDDGLDAIVDNWGTSDAFFLDPGEVSSSGGAASAFVGARSRKLRFVPVTGISRPMAERNAAVSSSHSGLCVRISPNDLLGANLAQDVSAFVAAHQINISTVDMVVDLGSVQGQNAFVVASAATAAMQALPNLTQWRTLTVVSSAFPTHMGDVPRHGSQLVDRTDFLAWHSLHAKRAQLQRLPTFGDYGIQHPEGVSGYDPRFMPMSAAIRYTLNSHWLLIKGQSKKKQPLSAQYPSLARKLVAAGTHYYGQTHCMGCGHVHACANNQPRFGSAEAWRKIGTNHHLEVVAAQLASAAYP